MTKEAGEPRIVRRPDWKELDKRFEPYAIQLGWLAYSWNSLHERLGNLFWTLTGLQDGRIPIAIWNAIENDRAQREMVRAIAEVALTPDNKAKREILWVLGKAQSFEDKRNDALHTPLTFMIDADGPRLSSKWFSGHRSATKLKDKDLLEEFKWYGRTANVLSQYVWHISYHLRDPSKVPLPHRPELPALGQSPTP
jgi:hypothetical protein